MAAADPVRIATWNADLSRDGPGLLLRDILKDTPGTSAVAEAIAAAAPDILLLTDVDFDHDLVALGALSDRIEGAGGAYPHRFALRPNTGLPTGADLDGDGRLGGPRDAQGYGEFAGQGGMAILSKWPLRPIADFSGLLWRDVPDTSMRADDTLTGAQRLSTSGHWVVAVETPGGVLTLMAFAATPPVFDGPEDRNGRRNRDEVLLWRSYLDGGIAAPPEPPFVLFGDANLDPLRGDGLRDAMRTILGDARLRDPLPGRPTALWEEVGEMRVSYVLPSAGLRILSAGVLPPVGEEAHRMVMVTVDLP
ncbi:endonuclease/exonuclease/phosphatase family protein [Salipiger sp.]|uniref:endonuclease/exonuclease/phosphatase family protein n=1 Tax=Salipiger sp. TaxID=2078585 RepID=UPI003A96AA4C